MSLAQSLAIASAAWVMSLSIEAAPRCAAPVQQTVNTPDLARDVSYPDSALIRRHATVFAR